MKCIKHKKIIMNESDVVQCLQYILKSLNLIVIYSLGLFYQHISTGYC